MNEREYYIDDLINRFRNCFETEDEHKSKLQDEMESMTEPEASMTEPKLLHTDIIDI